MVSEVSEIPTVLTVWISAVKAHIFISKVFYIAVSGNGAFPSDAERAITTARDVQQYRNDG